MEEAHRLLRVGYWWYDSLQRQGYFSPEMSVLFPDRFDDSINPSVDIGKHLHPEDEEVFRLLVDRCLLSGESFTLRVRTYCGDEIRWIKQIVQPLQKVIPSKIGLIGICQDISDVVLEETKSHYEKSIAVHEARLSSLGELAGGIAHEINNPLAIIRGAIGLLPRIASDHESLKLKVNMIDRAVQRIAGIIMSLNRFSRPESRGPFQSHAVAKMLSNALFFLESYARKEGVIIAMKGDSTCKIYCNEIEIEQVFFSILKFAINAASKSSEKNVGVSWKSESQKIHIRIDHSGTMENFKETEKSERIQSELSSFGMVIVRSILQTHQARLNFTEYPKSSFHIEFEGEEGVLHAA